MRCTHRRPPVRLLPLLFPIALLSGACAPAPEPAPTRLDHLAAWMTGSFSSADQAAADTLFLDIRLRMAPVWSHRTDGPWLYVEQAAATDLDTPYRQRIYHLAERPDGVLESAVLEIPDPLRFAGAWRTGDLGALTPDSLLARPGCSVLLTWDPDGGRYAGSTPGTECLSQLRGAAWATSEVTVTAEGITSWDRGWNAAGEQVWGSRHGAYVFDREPS